VSKHEKKRPPSRFGKLPPRYRFILNPYRDCRFTTCPICKRTTRWRKFVLLVHIDPMILLALNKHCRFCPDCELLIVHQDELETELAVHLDKRAPAAIGNEYLVLGTLERAAWREGMQHPMSLAEMLEQLADFKEVLTVESRPAGWYPAEGAP
jgi:hypothetical protein